MFGNLSFLAAGYAVFWVVSFVFVYSLVSRQRSLQKEVEMLEQLLDADTEAEKI